METPPREKLRVTTLQEGGHYLQASGSFVRRIERIIGNDVFWHDRIGPGKCTRQTFVKNCVYEATTEEIEKHMKTDAVRAISDTFERAFPDGFARRDEANAIVAFAFRNTSLEDLHAGKKSDLLNDDSYSRITEAEMKALMIQACEKMESLLQMKEEHPEQYRKFIQTYGMSYCSGWNRR
jgi:hypothetical protein